MNIHVQPLGQPTPGSARPGNLYADLQSRSLWLGVDLAVDATGSVLISDMIALMDDIAQAEARANAYTDAGLAAKAPTVHTHTASQITDFNSAVQGIVTATPGLTFKRYTIMMFAGTVTDIGVGDWVGWALCDGTAYDIPKPGGGTDHVVTPDLRDKFVLGSSALHSQKSVNVVSSASTSDAGSHTHSATPTALTINMLPAHSHPPGTLFGPTVGSITAAGSHDHFVTGTTIASGGGAYRPLLTQSGNSVNFYTNTEPNHSHGITSLDADITAGVTGNTGAGAAHTHIMDTQGAHKHTVSMAELREAVPFMALAYIMKL